MAVRILASVLLPLVMLLADQVRIGIRVVGGGGGSQTQLTFDMMTWLGTFRSPSAVENGGGSVSDWPLLTARRRAGTLRIFMAKAANATAPSEIIECDYPGYNATFASSPQMSANCVNWGNGFRTLLMTGDSTRGGSAPRIAVDPFWVTGIHWSNACSCLWVVGGDNYNVSGFNDPVLVRGDLNDGTNTASWSGPWRFTGSVSGLTSTPSVHQTHSYIVDVPAAWGKTYASGATLALGGGQWSGNSKTSWNDSLWAFVAPTSSQNTYLSHGSAADISAINLVGGDINHRGLRPSDYAYPEYVSDVDVNAYTGGTSSRTTLNGRFTSIDSSGDGTALWIDWTDTTGLLFANSLGRGHIWYSNPGVNGGVCTHSYPDRYANTGPVPLVRSDDSGNSAFNTGPDKDYAVTIREMSKLAPQAGVRPDLVEIFDMEYMALRYTNFVYDNTVGGTSTSCGAFNVNCTGIKLMGMAADETSRLIFMATSSVPAAGAARFVREYVNVFSVASPAPTPTPAPMPPSLPLAASAAVWMLGSLFTRRAQGRT